MLDWISRDQADIATRFKHLRFAGVTIVTLAEGEITEPHVGLKGTMNDLFLKDLAAKTHRGLRGRVENAKSGGGIADGYGVVRQLDQSGELQRGDREIVEHEAQIVRRIFRAFASGAAPRARAKTLNEGVPGPGGAPWIDATLDGQLGAILAWTPGSTSKPLEGLQNETRPGFWARACLYRWVRGQDLNL